jgi:hypothetical protein
LLAFIAKPVLSGEEFPNLPLSLAASPTPTGSPDPTPSSVSRPVTMVSYALLSGNRSGTTESMAIPFPYWEISYTAEPSWSDMPNATSDFPRLKIQIVDADDPSRIVRNLEPDLLDARINTTYDPRPWKERIIEGYHRYYFVVHIQKVRSYSIHIRVPSE